jgi:hypothetical protein
VLHREHRAFGTHANHVRLANDKAARSAVRVFLTVVASAVVVCGCGQTVSRLVASAAGDNARKCFADNRATPEGQMLAKRIWQFDDTDTAEKLNDPRPLTPEERNALVQLHSRSTKCRQIIIEL